MHLSHTRRLATVVASLSLVTSTAACGSSGGNAASTGGPTASTVSSSASSGLPEHKASGTPVVVGFINSDSSPLGDFSDLTSAAKGLSNYVNNNLGGLGGHPVDLQTCADNGADNAAASCATKLLAKKPIAVITGLDTGANGSVPVLAKAGVAYVGTTPINSAELATPGAYTFSAGIPGAFGAADIYVAKTLKAKSVGLVTNDTATAKSTAENLGVALLKSLGVSAKIVTHSLTETDLTASWASGSQGADAVYAIEPSAQCVAAMKARAAAGSSTPLIMFGCSDTATIKAAGSAADGAIFGQAFESPDGNTPDAKLYQKVMDTYASGAQRDAYTESIMSAFVVLSRILAKTTTVTAASTKTAIAAAKNVKGFLTPPITCDGKQVPQLVAMCGGAAYVVKNSGGKLVDVGGGAKNIFAA